MAMISGQKIWSRTDPMADQSRDLYQRAKYLEWVAEEKSGQKYYHESKNSTLFKQLVRRIPQVRARCEEEILRLQTIIDESAEGPEGELSEHDEAILVSTIDDLVIDLHHVEIAEQTVVSLRRNAHWFAC